MQQVAAWKAAWSKKKVIGYSPFDKVGSLTNVSIEEWVDGTQHASTAICGMCILCMHKCITIYYSTYSTKMNGLQKLLW